MNQNTTQITDANWVQEIQDYQGVALLDVWASNLQTWYPVEGKLKLRSLNIGSSKIVTVHKQAFSAVLD